MAKQHRLLGNGHVNNKLRVGLGMAAGLAGTKVMERSMAAGEKIAPQATPPIERSPADFLIEKAEERLPDRVRERVTPQAERYVSTAAPIGYGAMAGALYAFLRPNPRKPLRDGILLGTAVWAIGYLGWLPRAGLLPPVSEQKAPQVAGPIVQHAIYGIVTAATFRVVYGALRFPTRLVPSRLRRGK